MFGIDKKEHKMEGLATKEKILFQKVWWVIKY